MNDTHSAHLQHDKYIGEVECEVVRLHGLAEVGYDVAGALEQYLVLLRVGVLCVDLLVLILAGRLVVEHVDHAVHDGLAVPLARQGGLARLLQQLVVRVQGGHHHRALVVRTDQLRTLRHEYLNNASSYEHLNIQYNECNL